MFKKVLLALVLIVVVFVAIGFLLPDSYRVSRSVVIAAEPAVIYEQVADLKTWPEWSAWTKERDPSVEWTFEGTEVGPGMVWRWEGETLGRGELTLTGGDPASGIQYDLAFDDGAYSSKGDLLFEADEAGTLVTFANYGELGGNPLSRYFGLLMDKLMGPDFEKGLDGLKSRVEGGGAVEMATEAATEAAGETATDAAQD